MYDIDQLYSSLTSHYACAVMLCVTFVPALTIVISVHLCVCIISKYLERANYVDASVLHVISLHLKLTCFAINAENL